MCVYDNLGITILRDSKPSPSSPRHSQLCVVDAFSATEITFAPLRYQLLFHDKNRRKACHTVFIVRAITAKVAIVRNAHPMEITVVVTVLTVLAITVKVVTVLSVLLMVTVLSAHVLIVVMVDSVPITMTVLIVHATIVVMVATVLSVLMEVHLMVVLLMAIVLNVRVLIPMVVEDQVDMAALNNAVHRIMIRMQSIAVRSR